MALVECVPNISEGRDRAIIDAVTAEVERTDGCTLLDVDPGQATNRTVITIVGDPDSVVEGAFRLIAKAAELIDMSGHKGEHARMGATDVCPFVPVSGITMEECAELARRLGKRVAEELSIPVYLYEYAASKPERKNLARVRSGEYEGLEEKFRNPEWAPDFGEPVFNARSGATAIGARKFLIAYNINLNTRDKKLANDIALNIREAGRNKRGPDGKFVRDDKGVPINQPGLFKEVKAVGWYIEEYNRAQISINFTDWEVSSIHDVFDEVCRQAVERGMRVTGSELVGLVPKAAILQAGIHYLDSQGRSIGIPEADIIETAIQSLGLSDLVLFDPADKIIEYRVGSRMGELALMTVQKFVDEVSSESPAPGGGSVAALCGAMGTALAGMVANLTVGKKGYNEYWSDMSTLAAEAQVLKDFFLEAIDKDTEAFTAVIDAWRLPKKTAEDKAISEAAVLAAMKAASLVPMETLEKCLDTCGLAERAAAHGNTASLSDAAVGACCAEAAAESAWFNVLINLNEIDDAGFVSKTQTEADAVLAKVRSASVSVRDAVRAKLQG